MRTLPVIACIVTAAALAIPAAAQSSDDSLRPMPAQHQRHAQQGAQGQKGQRVIQAMRRIGVDEARINQCVKIHEKYASQHQRLRADAARHREALRTLIEQDSKDEKAFQRTLDGLEKTKQAHDRLRDAEQGEIRKVLKPSEQAKLLAMRHRQGQSADRAPGQRQRPHARAPESNGPQRAGNANSRKPRGPRPASAQRPRPRGAGRPG